DVPCVKRINVEGILLRRDRAGNRRMEVFDAVKLAVAPPPLAVLVVPRLSRVVAIAAEEGYAFRLGIPGGPDVDAVAEPGSGTPDRTPVLEAEGGVTSHHLFLDYCQRVRGAVGNRGHFQLATAGIAPRDIPNAHGAVRCKLAEHPGVWSVASQGLLKD